MNGRRTAAVGGFLAVLLLSTPTVALAHGDSSLVDEVLELAPGGSAEFAADLHYHRLVGTMSADGPIRVRLVDATTGKGVLTLGPSTSLAFNELVRCCDQEWAPHTLTVENVGDDVMTVAAPVRLVHDDLAVMVDGAESGTRLVLGATRRPQTAVPLRRPTIGLAVLAAFVLALGSYATVRYGVGGAPSVVAGNADLPVIPMNDIVSRASLLVGLFMIGWGRVGLWWVRARPATPSRSWTALGVALTGAVLVVAVAVLTAYGGPLVQTVWAVVAAGPIVTVLVRQVCSGWSATNSSRRSTSSRAPTNTGVRWWMSVGMRSRSEVWPSEPRPPACSARKASGAPS